MSDSGTQKAARLAASAASIMRGAASGGLYGAAAGAVKSFLPEIAGGVLTLTAAAILLPVLVFAALPNIFFGYENADAGDIVALTDKARETEEIYLLLSDYDKDLIDALTEEVKAAYTNESGALFDETEVTTDIGNLNIYRFIAIASVLHGQDLFATDETSIKAVAAKKFDRSAELFTRTEGEGAVTTVTLKIGIRDLSPEEFTDELGFTDEQKDWAELLYNALTEDQYVGREDGDGPGLYGTDYGDIVFKDASTEIVYYNQTDARWGALPYGKTGTIATSGCGPAALAIVVSSLTGNAVTPREVAAWSAANGYKCEGSGSYHSLIPAGGAHFGLAVESLGKDAAGLARALEEGKPVIAIMRKGHFTSGGHFIVLRGMTAEGRILVADPASVKRSEKEWAFGSIVNEANRGAGAGGPFWAFSLP
jgi:hypothetical protein